MKKKAIRVIGVVFMTAAVVMTGGCGNSSDTIIFVEESENETVPENDDKSQAETGAAGRFGTGTQPGAGAADQSGTGIIIQSETEAATQPETENETAAQPETGNETANEKGMQDGERFEEVIMLEGMEETVKYEHVRNDKLGIETDYEYESMVRQKEPDKESFISLYDDINKPENYLEISYRPESADTLAASVSESLSGDYDIIKEQYELNNAGSCIRIVTTNAKGGGTSRLLQTVYIIPAVNGSIVGTAHYTIESAEGYGSRFAYIMNTLVVNGRDH